VISDIHGNLPAASAVLSDIGARGFDLVVSIGDMVSKGPQGPEVVDLLRSKGVQMLLGGGEFMLGLEEPNFVLSDETAAQDRLQVYEWERSRTTQDQVEFLTGLPFSMTVDLNGVGVDLFHATPWNCFDLIFPDAPSHEIERLRLSGESKVSVCGHTHRPFVRTIRGHTYINAGSVGQPFDGDWRACYVSLEAGPCSQQVCVIRVEYDVEAAIRAGRESGMPAFHAYEKMLRAGSYPYPHEPRATDKAHSPRRCSNAGCGTKGEGHCVRLPDE
jgi:predicted phosphodiesterase